jgi:hypothetical protein
MAKKLMVWAPSTVIVVDNKTYKHGDVVTATVAKKIGMNRIRPVEPDAEAESEQPEDGE